MASRLDNSTQQAPLLEIASLGVTFDSSESPVKAVRGVSVSVRAGEVLGIVGESGSGKSVTMLAAMGLLPTTASVSGSVRFEAKKFLGWLTKTCARFEGVELA